MNEVMNKLYYFTGNDGESGIFTGAKTWREARNSVIGSECFDGCEFTDIRGHVCKESNKPVRTKLSGEHDADDLMASGYTNFWWMGDCAKCGKWDERLNPVSGEMICSDCEEGETDETDIMRNLQGKRKSGDLG